MDLFLSLVGILFLLGLFIAYIRFFRSRSPLLPHDAHVVSASIFLLAFFAFFTGAAVAIGRTGSIDGSFTDALRALHSPFLLSAMIAASAAFDWQHFLILSLSLVVLLFFLHQRRASLFTFSALLFAFLLDWNMKILLHLPRPLHPLIPVSGFGYPSGHATLAIAFFLILAFILRSPVRSIGGRVLLVALAYLLAGIVGFSRIYLGAHWASDVAGGIILGTFAVLFLAPLFSKE